MGLRLAKAEVRLAAACNALEQHQVALETDQDDVALPDEFDFQGNRAEVQK